MTSPAHPDRQGTREELGQTVLNAMLASSSQPYSGNLALDIADALLPVVERLCDQRAAEALEAALAQITEARDSCGNAERRNGYLGALFVLKSRIAALHPAATRENGAGS